MKRICVIGGGRWGKNHIRTLHQLGCLAAIAEANEAKLQEHLAAYPGTIGHSSVDEAIEASYDGYTLQAAILQVKFRAFRDYELDAVNKAAAMFTERLSDVVDTPVVPEGYYSSWAQYTIKLKDKESRNALQTALKEAGIPSMVYYPTPMHKQTAHAPYGPYADDLCPVTTSLCDRVLSLLIHPYITEEDVEMVCSIVSKLAL